MLDLFLSSMALAIAAFCLCLLLPQHKNHASRPLSLILLCLIFLASGPVVFSALAELRQLYIAVLPIAFYALLPSLWLYHEALIAQTPWHWTSKANKHFLTLPLVIIISLVIFLLPEQDFNNMFFSDIPVNTSMATFSALSFFSLLLVWCVLSLIYVIAIFKRTLDYHSRLKQMYSNEQGKTLRWVKGISLLLVFTWVYALAVLALENRYQQYGVSDTGVFLLLLILVWLLATNGLRQKPGFAEVFQIESNNAAKASAEESKAKYQRSALNADDFERIAAKLTQAICQDAVHLDADLNLLKLAKHIAVPSQYISQTLNQHLNISFFDFINQARIEDAKPQLIDSNKSVLDIALAVGFNARSSFYKAFNQSTGMTPGEYKKRYKVRSG